MEGIFLMLCWFLFVCFMLTCDVMCVAVVVVAGGVGRAAEALDAPAVLQSVPGPDPARLDLVPLLVAPASLLTLQTTTRTSLRPRRPVLRLLMMTGRTEAPRQSVEGVQALSRWFFIRIWIYLSLRKGERKWSQRELSFLGQILIHIYILFSKFEQRNCMGLFGGTF